jgi:hypothetical protein
MLLSIKTMKQGEIEREIERDRERASDVGGVNGTHLESEQEGSREKAVVLLGNSMVLANIK